MSYATVLTQLCFILLESCCMTTFKQTQLCFSNMIIGEVTDLQFLQKLLLTSIHYSYETKYFISCLKNIDWLYINGDIKLVSPRHLLLKCLHQARTLSGHVFVLRVSLLSLSTIVLLNYRTNPKMSCFMFFILIVSMIYLKYCWKWL